MTTLDLLIFLLYLAGVTVLGGSFFRKNRSAAAFTLGNRDIPGWVVTLSIFATFVSSISYLALPGAAFQSNWNPFVFSLTLPVAAFFAVRFFVPLYRKVNSPSAYTYLEVRFGPWARLYASACYLLTQLMRTGTILYLLALALHAMIGWNIAAIIIVTGIVVLAYSVLGGLQAVVWTDAVQGIILIAGAVVCAGYLLLAMPEGPGQLFAIAAEQHKFSLGSFRFNWSEPTFWVVLLYGLFINLQNFGIDQNYVQRYLASRSDRGAKRSAFFGAIIYLPVSALFLFIGTALYAYYHSGAAGLPSELQELSQSDRVFPYFIVHALPPGITGLLVASIFAAGMSTVSTSFNSSATVFLTDYYQPRVQRAVSDREAMRVLFLSSLVIGIIGIGIAIAMINVKSALDAWWKLASVFSGGMLGLFLLGAFSRQSHSRGAAAGVIAGLLIILWLSLSNLFPGREIFGPPLHPYLTIVLGTMAIFFTGFLVSVGIDRVKRQ